MTSSETTSSSDILYASLPTHPQNVVVLTYYNPPNPFLRRCLIFTLSILLLSLTIYFLYPSDPSLQLARLRLNHARVNFSSSFPTLDLSFSLVIKVYNRDLFSLEYDWIGVSVGYRGRELGFVDSEGGKVRPRGNSYVNATLELNGFEVVHDVFYLIEDLARGVVPFDTVTSVDGFLGLFFFQVPIKAKVSCEVYVNTNNQTIVRQDCYPELFDDGV